MAGRPQALPVCPLSRACSSNDKPSIGLADAVTSCFSAAGFRSDARCASCSRVRMHLVERAVGLYRACRQRHSSLPRMSRHPPSIPCSAGMRAPPHVMSITGPPLEPSLHGIGSRLKLLGVGTRAPIVNPSIDSGSHLALLRGSAGASICSYISSYSQGFVISV